MSNHLIKLPANTLITGSTQSGKTYYVKKLIRDIADQIDVLIIISSTMKISNDYDEFEENDDYDRGMVIKKYSSDYAQVITELVQAQQDIIDAYGKKSLPNVFVVLDDLVGAPLLRFRGLIDNLSVKSRHYRVSLCVLGQRITAIPRTFRLNSKYTVMFNCCNYTELERFIQEYCPSRFKKTLTDHLQEIYNEPYNYILACNFENTLKNRLWINGETNLIEKFMDN